LTAERERGTLGDMVGKLQRLDPDRRRRRLQLLAVLAEARAVREREQPIGFQGHRVRGLIAWRRRLVS
jgi:hypothetical protein